MQGRKLSVAWFRDLFDWIMARRKDNELNEKSARKASSLMAITPSTGMPSQLGQREQPQSLHRRFLSRFLGWLIRGLWFLCQVAMAVWATLAIYYSNLPWAALRLGLAGAFAAFAIWALWWSREWRMSVAFIVL